MGAIDHILAAAILFISLSQMGGDAAAAIARAPRRTFYTAGIATGAGLAAASLALWVLQDRPLAGFGLYGWTGGPEAAAAGLGWTAALALLFGAVAAGRGHRLLRPFYTPYQGIMPRSRVELAHSWGASAAAGVGEEIAFRGFLFWYLAAFLGVPAAAIVSSVLFGLCHGYQRLRGILFASAVGLLLAALYVATGSLLLLIWMHASYNMATFTAGRLILRPV